MSIPTGEGREQEIKKLRAKRDKEAQAAADQLDLSMLHGNDSNAPGNGNGGVSLKELGLMFNYVGESLFGDPERADILGDILGYGSPYDTEPTFRQPWQAAGEHDKPLRTRFLASTSPSVGRGDYPYPAVSSKDASGITVAFADVSGIAGIGALIGQYESRGGNYNIWNGGRELPLTSMTIDQVIARQARWRDIPGANSSAAGKYQIVQSTLIGLKQKMGLTGKELFDPAMQDRMGLQLMVGRGLNDFLNGRITTNEFMHNLSKEWAALPKDMGGESFHKGVKNNEARVTPHTVIAVLENAKEQYQRLQQRRYAESEAAKEGSPQNFKDNAGDVGNGTKTAPAPQPLETPEQQPAPPPPAG